MPRLKPPGAVSGKLGTRRPLRRCKRRVELPCIVLPTPVAAMRATPFLQECRFTNERLYLTILIGIRVSRFRLCLFKSASLDFFKARRAEVLASDRAAADESTISSAYSA